MTTVTRVLGVLAIVLVVGLVLSGCKGEQGPAGPQGAPGTPTAAFEGYAADIKCGVCHTYDQDTTYFLLARRYQNDHSKHVTGGHVDRNGAGCARCHTTEGYLKRWLYGQDVGATQPSPIGCFVCHSPHARNNFSLRRGLTDAVTVQSNITGKADLLFNYGKGNQCVTCHQTRDMTPKMVANGSTADTVTITSSRWYSHYGVQSQMFAGDGGYVWPSETAPASGHKNVPALQQNACTMCHMVTPAGGNESVSGGHSMKIRYNATQEIGVDSLDSFNLGGTTASCNTPGCHSGIGKTQLLAFYKPVLDTLKLLENRLIAKNLLDATSLLVKGPFPKKVNGQDAGALYNYFFVEHDFSRGIHNYQYARFLLRRSLAKLN